MCYEAGTRSSRSRSRADRAPHISRRWNRRGLLERVVATAPHRLVPARAARRRRSRAATTLRLRARARTRAGPSSGLPRCALVTPRRRGRGCAALAALAGALARLARAVREAARRARLTASASAAPEQRRQRRFPARHLGGAPARVALRAELALERARVVEFAVRRPEAGASPASSPAPSAVVSITRGRRTGMPSRSAWYCMSQSFATAPPSTCSARTRAPASRAMASTRSRLWNASDSSAARTMCARVVPRVSPSSAPRTSARQWGAPRPTNAGTSTTPPESGTERAIASLSAALREQAEPVAQPLHRRAGDEHAALERVGGLAARAARDRGEQPGAREHGRRAGVQQQEAAGAVRVLGLPRRARSPGRTAPPAGRPRRRRSARRRARCARRA